MWFLFLSQRRRFNIKGGLHSKLCLRLKDKRPLEDHLHLDAFKCFSPIIRVHPSKHGQRYYDYCLTVQENIGRELEHTEKSVDLCVALP